MWRSRHRAIRCRRILSSSGSPKGVGEVHLHAVVDTFGSYGFGFPYVSKQPEAAVAVLHNDVLPLPHSPSAGEGGTDRQWPRFGTMH